MPPEATILSYSSIVIRWSRDGTHAGTPSVAGGIVDAVVDMGTLLPFEPRPSGPAPLNPRALAGPPRGDRHG